MRLNRTVVAHHLTTPLPDIGEIPVIETSLETADLSDTVQEVKKTSKKKKS